MTCSWRSPGSMWALLCGQSVALKWHVLWNVRVLQALPSPGSEESGPHLMLLVDSDIRASVNSSYQGMTRPLGPHTTLCVINCSLLGHISRVRLCVTPETAAHQAPPSWDSPGKNTGVGCHFLLQCRKVKSESEVSQSCQTLSDPMDCSPPGSSVHGIFQARVLEWGAIAFSETVLWYPAK